MRVLVFIAMRQLWARRGLNATALAGVALGVVMLIVIGSLVSGVQSRFLENMLKANAHVTVYDTELHPAPPLLARYEDGLVASTVSHENPSDRQTRIRKPMETVRVLSRMDGVVAVAPSLGGSAIVSYGSKEYPVDLRAIDPEAQEAVTPIAQNVVAGSYRTFVGATDGILLGSGVASRTGAHVGDVMVVSGPRGDKLDLHVSAIVDSNIPAIDNVRVYANLRNGQTLLGKPDIVSRLEIRTTDPDRAPEVTARVERVLGYDAESWQEQNANFLSLFVQQRAINMGIVGAILVVGGFGILAIQIMIVLQKTRDIAILRSYGFKKRDVLFIFLSQGAILASAGAVLGEVLGHLGVVWIAAQKTHIETIMKADSWPIHESASLYVIGSVFALVLGLVASFLPALRASRVEPVDVLRGQIG